MIKKERNPSNKEKRKKSKVKKHKNKKQRCKRIETNSIAPPAPPHGEKP